MSLWVLWYRWAKAVVRHSGLVAGGTVLGIVGWFWNQYGPTTAIPTKVFSLAVTGCVIVAFFLAWRDEYLAREKAEAECREYTEGTKRPLLSPFIDAIVQGIASDGRLAAAIIINIGNRGLPSIAQHWRTLVHGPTGTLELPNVHLHDQPTTLLYLDRKKEVRLDPKANLLAKALTPIINGGSCRGVLYFRELARPLQIGETLELTLEDGYHNAYTLKEEITKDLLGLKQYANLEMTIVDVAQAFAPQQPIFELSPPYCRETTNEYGPVQLGLISLKNTSDKTIDGVRVKLSSLSPDPNNVSRMSRVFIPEHFPNTRPDDAGFSLNPEEPLPINIGALSRQYPYHLHLYCAPSELLPFLEGNSYRIHIQVVGRDVGSRSSVIELKRENERLKIALVV